MKKSIPELVRLLNHYTDMYDQGYPEISDKEWDDLYFELVQMEKEAGYALPDSPTQKITYSVVNQLNKVTHNHKMLSLDKTKDLNEVHAFLGDKQYYMAMLKMDGLTCSLTYQNGKLVAAETRGNGEIGEDLKQRSGQEAQSGADPHLWEQAQRKAGERPHHSDGGKQEHVLFLIA